jgi:glutamate-1-semialdehyde 2,1-aminomutase
VATLSIAGSPGVPAGAVADIAVRRFNDLDSVGSLFAERGASVACVLVEPVAGNMGCVPPAPGFLEGLRRLCDEHESLLIFDEVMTGFRLSYGGAQALYGVRPDLTCLGKVIGAGLPVAAYGGRRDLMSMLAPSGVVYQAGTLSGNPLGMAAGCAVLDRLRNETAYATLEALGARLQAGLEAAAAAAGQPCAVNRVGSMVTPFLGVERVVDYETARRADRERFAALHRDWLRARVLWPPSQFETAFLSTAHQPADIDDAVAVFGETLRALSEVRRVSQRV